MLIPTRHIVKSWKEHSEELLIVTPSVAAYECVLQGVIWGQLWEYGAMLSYMLSGHCTNKERALSVFLSFTKNILPVCSCIASLLFANNVICLASS